MARNEFFRDVRRAVSFLSTTVEADNSSTDTGYIQRMLRSADLWLTRSVVAAYREEDFPDLSEAERYELTKAVSEFRKLAESAPPKGPAPLELREAAAPLFRQIVQSVQGMLLQDWLNASGDLLKEAEEWSKEQGWPVKRYSKNVKEDFLGSYKQERLVFSAEGSQLALVPVGRFAPGTDGMFDLAVMPAYDSVMVVRKGDRWFIHPRPGEEGRQDWTRESFEQASLELARLP
jgi:hypothetical protein